MDWESCTKQLLTLYEEAVASPTHLQPNDARTIAVSVRDVGLAWLMAAALGVSIKLGFTDTGTLARHRAVAR